LSPVFILSLFSINLTQRDVNQHMFIKAVNDMNAFPIEKVLIAG